MLYISLHRDDRSSCREPRTDLLPHVAVRRANAFSNRFRRRPAKETKSDLPIGGKLGIALIPVAFTFDNKSCFGRRRLTFSLYLPH
jgi:hypothetical protein